MAGIVEPHAGAPLLRRPGVDRERLGALHVGIEPAQPEQPGAAAGAGAHCDFSRVAVAANLDKGRFRIGYASCCGHGWMPRRKTVWLSPRNPSTDAVQAMHAAPRTLAEPAAALYVGSARNFGDAGVAKMSRI